MFSYSTGHIGESGFNPICLSWTKGLTQFRTSAHDSVLSMRTLNPISRFNETWVSAGYSQIFTASIHGLQVNLVLIRLVAMGFNWVFSDLYCRYTWPTGESGFN